jgi:hypothetical protein
MKHYIISMPLYKHDKVDTRCKECSAEFKNLTALRIHSKEEHQKMVYNLKRCLICGEEMKNDVMKKHWKTHEPDQKYYACTSCTFVTHDHNKLKSHRSWAHKHKVCLICSRSFHSFNHLQTHIEVKHGKEEYERLHCDLCGANLAGRQSLHSHMHQTHLIKAYCNICNKGLTYRQIGKHNILHECKHKDNEELKCDHTEMCQTMMIEHQKSPHWKCRANILVMPDLKGYAVHIEPCRRNCFKNHAFSSKSYRDKHESSFLSFGCNELECQTASKAISRKTLNLAIEHLETDHAEFFYVCEICGLKVLKTERGEHLLSKLDKLKCMICDKMFISAGDKIDHEMFEHYGNKTKSDIEAFESTPLHPSQSILAEKIGEMYWLKQDVVFPTSATCSIDEKNDPSRYDGFVVPRFPFDMPSHYASNGESYCRFSGPNNAPEYTIQRIEPAKWKAFNPEYNRNGAKYYKDLSLPLFSQFIPKAISKDWHQGHLNTASLSTSRKNVLGTFSQTNLFVQSGICNGPGGACSNVEEWLRNELRSIEGCKYYDVTTILKPVLPNQTLDNFPRYLNRAEIFTIFKVRTIHRTNGEIEIQCFKFPNKPCKKSAEDCKVELADVERLSGHLYLTPDLREAMTQESRESNKKVTTEDSNKVVNPLKRKHV